MSYRRRAPQAVLEALKWAHEYKGEPVTIAEVQEAGNYQIDDVPSTEISNTESERPAGGWTPFDFPDRTQKWLDNLTRRGLVERHKVGRRLYYEPTYLGGLE